MTDGFEKVEESFFAMMDEWRNGSMIGLRQKKSEAFLKALCEWGRPPPAPPPVSQGEAPTWLGCRPESQALWNQTETTSGEDE